MDILDLLASPTRRELSDNRLTSCGAGLGAGSLNWWDGATDDNGFQISNQSENVFFNRDGDIELLDYEGKPVVPQIYDHHWRPDRVRTNFILPHYVLIEQTRWLDDNAAGLRLRITQASRRPEPPRFQLRWSGEMFAGERVVWNENQACLHRTRGRLAGIWRMFGFFASGKGRQSIQTNGRGLRMQFEVPPEGLTLYLVWALGDDEKKTRMRLDQVIAQPEKSLAAATARWERFFNEQVPLIEGLPGWLEKQYYHLFYVHQANHYPAMGGCFPHPFTSPSKFRLLPQWFWDSAFHSIVEKWLYRFPAAKGSLLNILDTQKPDGRLAFALDKNGFIFDRWYDYPIIQPFVLPVAVWDIFLSEGNLSWLRKTLPAMVAFDQWMTANRSGRDGLICIECGGENGWDNSVRFGLKSDDPAECGRQTPKGMELADFNTFVLLGRQLISRMAGLVGKGNLAEAYRRKALAMERAMKKLWNPTAGLFSDRCPDGRLTDVLSPGGLVPMLAGLADKKQARRMVQLLTDERHFWSRYPVPTLSMSHPQFTDRDEYASYWNGRTWPNVNWLVSEGLIRYGYADVARTLIERSFEMVSAGGEPEATENYSPNSYQKYQPYSNIINYGWGSLTNDLLLRRILGIEPRMASKAVLIQPLWLRGLKEVNVRNLRVANDCLAISYRLKNGKISIDARPKGKLKIIRNNNYNHFWLSF